MFVALPLQEKCPGRSEGNIGEGVLVNKVSARENMDYACKSQTGGIGGWEGEEIRG